MNPIQLAIHISRTSVTFAEVLRSNASIVRQETIEWNESSPAEYKNKLKDFFSDSSWEKEYNEYTLAWATPQHSLVPLKVFNDSSAQSIFHFLFGEIVDKQSIDYNRLMELNMVNVSEIPTWVKSFFIIKFPHINIKHENAMTLRALFQKNAFKRRVVISLCDEYLTINNIHHNKLLFSNSFHYQSSDDILYYLMFMLKQERLEKEEAIVDFYYANPEAIKVIATVKEKIAQLKGHKLKPETIDSKLKLQLLCV